MAEFDNVMEQDRLAPILNELRPQMQQAFQNQNQMAQNQIIQNQQIGHDMIFLREQVNLQQVPPPYYPPPPPPHYPLPPPPQPLPPFDLKLPQPPFFSGTPSELRSFKLRLCQFLSANPQAYHNDINKILYSGQLLTGSARKWYEALLDPVSFDIPPAYAFSTFLQDMTDFFGGSVNVQTLERALI